MGKFRKKMVGGLKAKAASQQQAQQQRAAIRPLDAVYSEQDNQESATQDLYRRRRVSGMGGSMRGSVVGSSGGIAKKTLLGN